MFCNSFHIALENQSKIENRKFGGISKTTIEIHELVICSEIVLLYQSKSGNNLVLVCILHARSC